MNTSETFLIAMSIIFSLPYLIWRLLRTDYWAPLVVVQILVGIALGPGALGAVFPSVYQSIFTPQVSLALNGVAWWGVMLFVMLAGIELDLQQLWQHRVESGVTAALALSVPMLAGCAVALVLLALGSEWSGLQAQPWQFVLGIGMSCAVTALPILVLLMEKLEILETPLGQRILRYASLDDIAIWGVLALILLDWQRAQRQLLFLLGFALASWLLRQLMPRLAARDRWPLLLIWLPLCAYCADWSGLHFMVGAFLAGLVIDRAWFVTAQVEQVRSLVLQLLMPVFFLSTGLRTNWEAGSSAILLAAALLLSASIGGKLLGIQIAGRLLNWPRGQAQLIGWLLQTKALIMIIFTNVLLDKDIISNASFTALLLMAVLSTMLTIPAVAPQLQRSQT